MSSVYVFEKYPFYEGGSIIMISCDLEKVKNCFKDIVNLKKEGYGYVINKYELGKKYEYLEDKSEPVIWIEVEYGNELKVIHNNKLVEELLGVVIE